MTEKKILLEDKALWCSDIELFLRDKSRDALHNVSGIKPFHAHSGNIILNNETIQLTEDGMPEYYPLSSVTQLYLGFDDSYIPALTKNYGLFWKPLRITFQNNQKLYLVIGHNFITTKNQLWFKTIKELIE